jgi:predicted esterase
MTDHTPWDGWEHLFALPEGMGTVRVILVLAEKASWHNFPDHGTFRAGVAWLDILDVESMHRTDRLLERLVDHETGLLDGQSERIVLFGTSQGGGQSMMRFLRSRRVLGGWIGSVCHVPTAPHMPRDCDPLIFTEALVNRDRPVRLLAGEADVVFPPQLVLHDAERLQEVGQFIDVKVVVEPCMSHDGWLTAAEQRRQGMQKKTTAIGDIVGGDIVCESLAAWEAVPELIFLQRHLPSMLPKLKVWQPQGQSMG